MFVYEKKLQYPVKIKNPNPALAKVIISQLGGPHGELGAATRYLSQRFAMPDRRIIGMLTDVGTEELGHVEMISAILYQLTKNMTEEQIRNGGFDAYFVDHTAGIYPQAASGVPFSASTLASTGDVFADLHEDLAADGTTTKEQPVKAKCRKPLILLDFFVFSGCTSLTALQPYKDNKRLKSSKSYER